MNTDVGTLPSDSTVALGLEQFRRFAARQETISYNYVTDTCGKLLGIVSLRDLLLADPNTLLSDLMSTDVVVAWVGDAQHEVARKIREYDLIAFPNRSSRKLPLKARFAVADSPRALNNDNTPTFAAVDRSILHEIPAFHAVSPQVVQTLRVSIQENGASLPRGTEEVRGAVRVLPASPGA
jgi:hypothetical protein